MDSRNTSINNVIPNIRLQSACWNQRLIQIVKWNLACEVLDFAFWIQTRTNFHPRTKITTDLDLIEIFGQILVPRMKNKQIQNCKFRRDSRALKFHKTCSSDTRWIRTDTSIVVKIKGVINATVTMRMPWVWSIDMESQEIWKTF